MKEKERKVFLNLSALFCVERYSVKRNQVLHCLQCSYIFYISWEKKPSKRTLSTIRQDWIVNRKWLYIGKVSWITVLPNSTLDWVLLFCSYVKAWPFPIFYTSHMLAPISVPDLQCVRHPFSGLQKGSHLW